MTVGARKAGPSGAPATRGAPGSLESQVLTALWTLAGDPAGVSPAQVQQALGRGLAYTTVVTILTRLTAKGLLARERSGSGFRYRPLVTESAVTARHLEELLDRGADRRAVLRGIVDAISPQDAAVLRELLNSLDARTVDSAAGGNGQRSGSRPEDRTSP